MHLEFDNSILNDEFIKKLIEDFKQAHPTIADQFFSGVGGRLQNKDGKIMADIIDYFVIKKGIPAIPIHDSVIVPESYQEEAKQVMKEVYKKHMGFYPVIKWGAKNVRRNNY